MEISAATSSTNRNGRIFVQANPDGSLVIGIKDQENLFVLSQIHLMFDREDTIEVMDHLVDQLAAARMEIDPDFADEQMEIAEQRFTTETGIDPHELPY